MKSVGTNSFVPIPLPCPWLLLSRSSRNSRLHDSLL